MPDSSHTAGPVSRQRALRRLLAVALALTVGGVMATAAFTLWRLRAETTANALEIAAMNTRGFEDHLTQNLRAVEVAVGASLPDDPRAVTGRSGAIFADALRHSPFLRSLSLVDGDGRIVASSNPDNVGVRVPADGFLPPAATSGDILRIGPAWAGRDFAGGRPASGEGPVGRDALGFVPVLRSFRSGASMVTLLAAVNPDYFINHFERTLPVDAGSVSVARYDGAVLLSTDPGERPGTTDAFLAEAMRHGEVEFGRAEERRADGRAALVAFRASRLYPFAVVTRLDRDHALLGWRTEARTVAGLVIPMLLALALLTWGYYRRQSKLIVERAEAERLTRLNSTVFESSTDSIVITDPEARVVSVNAAFSRLCGYSRDEVIGRNPRLLSSGLQGKAFYEHMWRELLARDAWHGEIVNRRKDGSLYTARVAITAFRGPDGQLLHYVGISSDITARKHQEAQIEDLNRTLAQRAHEAEAANRAKSAFLANMSHELRTPVHAIMGMTDLVRRAVAEPKQKGRLDKVMAASRHLLAIISDVLDISRIEAEKLSLERTAMRLEDVVQGTIALVSHRASEKGLGLTVAMPDDLAVRTLWGDPLRLGQILLNLVSNAIKFTSEGSVAVTVVQVAEEAGELVVRCEVRDTGIGIGEEDRSRLFQAFAQVDDSMTRAYGGTGLGLAISKSLAQMMGGEIGVDSRPGAGSTFWFTCRLATTESPAAASASEATMAVTDGFRDGLAGARILLVEDDPMNREVAVGFLEGLAVTVDHAADGLEAVELARCHDYDLILMDITMPRMNGIEATRVIRRLPGREDTPILAMTANAFSADRQRCLDAGMNDFLGKPVSPDLLVEAMLRWMARRQA